MSVAVEVIARELAHLEEGEPWPTNAELGGSLTGDRDVEYRAGMREQARDLLVSALPHLTEGMEDVIASAEERWSMATREHFEDGGADPGPLYAYVATAIAEELKRRIES